MYFYRWVFFTNKFLIFFSRFLQIFFVEKIDINKKNFLLRILLGFTRDLDFFFSKINKFEKIKKKQCAWCVSIKKWLFLRFNKCFEFFSSIVSFLNTYYTFDDAGFRGSKIDPNPIGFYTGFWKKNFFLENLKFFHECGGYSSKITIFRDKRLFQSFAKHISLFPTTKKIYEIMKILYFFFQILTGNQAKFFIAKNSLLVSDQPF